LAHARGRLERLGPLAALLGVAGLALAGTAGVDYLPTHDGPQHVYSLHAAARLGDAQAGFGRWLEPNLPVTNHGFALLFSPLDALFGWRAALRLSLAAFALLWVGGAYACARALHPARAWLGVALASGCFQWALWMGFFSFYAASAAGLWILALAFAGRGGRGHHALLSALLLAQALMHVVPAALTGAVLAALLVLRAAPGRRVRALAGAAALGLPAGLVAAALLGAGLETLGDLNQIAGEEPASAQRAPWWSLGRCFLAGPAWRAWPLTLLAAAAPGLALASRGARRPEDRALLLCGALFLACAALLPRDLRAWDYFSMRFLPAAVSALVLALPVERAARTARRALAAACAAFALAATGWAAAYDHALAGRAREALGGLAAPLARGGVRLPLVLDPYLGRPFDERLAAVPYAVPLLNLGELYAAEQGGVTPYGFTVNGALHPVLWRAEARRAAPAAPDRRWAAELARPERAGDRALRRAVATFAAAHGADFEDVILWGRPEDVDDLLALGFDADFRRGGLAIARFRGCPLAVLFPPGSPAAGHTLELGWLPAGTATHRFDLARAHARAGGGLALPLRQTPCGGVWLRFAEGDLACAGAGPDGRLLVPSTRLTPRVECRPLARDSGGGIPVAGRGGR
jgi:hypothetical protein